MGKRASTPSKKKTPAKAKKSTISKAVIDPLKHFAYLTSSKNDEALLKLIFESAKVSEQKGVLMVELKNGFTLEATASSKKIPAKSPKTFSAVLKKHSSVTLTKGKNIVLQLGVTGIFDTETLEDNESPILDFVKNPKDLIFPLSEWQDCWVYNPSEKNESKEPVIYFFSHDTLDPTEPQECNIGSLFLLRCAHHLDIKPPESQIKNDRVAKITNIESIKLVAKPNNIFKNARCLNLTNGTILRICENEISLLELSSNKFKVLGKNKFPLATLPHTYETVRCQELKDGIIMLEIQSNGIFVLKIEKNTPVLVDSFQDDYKGRGAVVVDQTLCFYNDASSGLHLKSLADPGDEHIAKIKRTDINSGVSHNNLMVFAGAEGVYGFEPKAKLVNLVFKEKGIFVDPVIISTPANNQFIVFGYGYGIPAITLFKYEKSLKRVNSFYDDIYPMQWCWVKSSLYVFLHDHKKEKYSIGIYTWENDTLNMEKIVALDLGDDTWVWPNLIHVQNNTIHILNGDGMVWEVRLD